MKLRLFGFAVLILGLVRPAAATEPITSMDRISGLASIARQQFWRIAPPAGDDPFYLHPDPAVYAVDWKSKEWPAGFLKQMFAEMVTVNSSMYPVYKLSVVESRTGELLWYNGLDQLVWETPAPTDYNPYLFAFEFWDVDSEGDLTDQQKILGRSSNIGFQITMVPESFLESYQQDIAIEIQAAAVASAEMAPLVESTDSISVSISTAPQTETASSLLAEDTLMMSMTTMSSGPPAPPGGTSTNTTGGTSTSNLVVTLDISLPESFENNYIEIYSRDDLLLYTNWTLENAWVPTYGSNTVSWTDLESSNKTERFYLVSDATDTDGDGRSDYYESINGTSPITFNDVDSDSDDLHDWWEMKLFGDLDEDADDDFDNDGLLNDEELIPGHPPIMITDPSLYSSDGDSLGDAEMIDSPPTDPWNPDTTTPVASITWPTNNTVLTF